MKSLSQKRCNESSSASDNNVKRRRICDKLTYKSPLIHLGKTSDTTIKLDDSVIVLDELRNSPVRDTPTVIVEEKKRPQSPDDSVIILSDNDGEESETDNKGEEQITYSQPAAGIEKVIKKPSWRNRFKPRSKRTRLLKKKCPETNVEEELIIDSEDENIVPNNDASESNSQVEIITVDNSPGIEIDNNVIPPAVDSNEENDETGCHVGESPKTHVNKGEKLRNRLFAAAERLATLHFKKKIKNRPVFCKDANGDFTNLKILHNNGKQQCKSQQIEKSVRNNSANSFAKVSTNRSEVNGIGSYYTKETIVKIPGSLRVIVIDGCNIAMGYTNGQHFSEEGLKLVIDYFKLKGHTVKVFVPQHKRCKEHKLLESLFDEGIVAFTPSRAIGGKRIVSYDDRFILDYATMCDGIVVSLDQYRDLYREKPEWKNIIENRLLVPTFVGKCVMFPEDPLGRHGPKLEEFLRHQ